MKLPLKLQFFAEEVEIDDGANDPEIAEPEVDVVETSEEESPTPQDDETNAKYAAARRRAEAEYKAEIEKRDAEYARRFEGLSNPITGAPITNERDYFEALDAQEQLARNERLQNAGIDPSIIDEAISNNPMVREAQQIIEQNNKEMAKRKVDAEIAEINKFDPDIKTAEDIPAEQIPKLLDRVRAGLSLVDAYKIENLDKLMGKANAAATQRAINNAKNKTHLNTHDGVSENDDLLEIPSNALKNWQSAYPDLSYKELRKKYNDTL